MGASTSRDRIGSLIGEGGMGRVFLAEDRELGRKVALKFLPDEAESDPKVRERFRLEARAAAALDHPFICKVYEIGESEGIYLPSRDERAPSHGSSFLKAPSSPAAAWISRT